MPALGNLTAVGLEGTAVSCESDSPFPGWTRHAETDAPGLFEVVPAAEAPSFSYLYTCVLRRERPSVAFRQTSR